MHAVGEPRHQDQRRDHVDEQVQSEIEAAEDTERPQDCRRRADHGEQRQRYAAEEEIGNDGAEQEAEPVVDEAVALDGIADLELHDRSTGELDLEAGPREPLLRRLEDAADHRFGAALLDELAIERDHRERERAIVGKEFSGDDLVRPQFLDHRRVGVTLGQFVRHDRRRVAGRIGLVARRQHRDEAVDAIGQLEIDDRAVDDREFLARQQPRPLDDDEDVILARRKAPVDLLVLEELLGVGPEQFRETVVDLQAHHAEDGENGENGDQEGRQPGSTQCHQPQPFQSKCEGKSTSRPARLRHHGSPPVCPPVGMLPHLAGGTLAGRLRCHGAPVGKARNPSCSAGCCIACRPTASPLLATTADGRVQCHAEHDK